MPTSRAWLRSLLLVLLCAGPGCDTATTAPEPIPPSTIPDPATVQLLTGRWEGISTTTRSVEDYLDFTFRPQGEHVRVQVDVNRQRLAEPYAEVIGDTIDIDVADQFGNSGHFVGTLDRTAFTIEGTFTLLFNGTVDEGTFEMHKQ